MLELEGSEPGSAGSLFTGPGLGLDTEMAEILSVILVEHRLVGLRYTECLENNKI